MTFNIFGTLFDDKVLIWTIYLVLISFALETFGVAMVTGLLDYVIYKAITIRLILAVWGIVALWQLWYGRL